MILNSPVAPAPEVPKVIAELVIYCEYHQPGWMLDWSMEGNNWKITCYDTYSLEHVTPAKGTTVWCKKYTGTTCKSVKKGVALLYEKLLEKREDE